MNPIERAIAEAKWQIPMEILNRAFAPKAIFGRATALNIDSVIRSKVIDARVKVDCDLVGGTQLDIPLRNIHPEQVPLPSGTPYSWSLVYHIPMTLTQNRQISRVLWIANTISPISGTYTYASYNGSALGNAAMGVMQSQAPIPSMSTARVDIIAPNTVMVSDTNQWPYDATMRCFVENDPDFTLLPAGAIRPFCKLCILAIKAYIYNALIIQMNTAEITMGQELGRFKEVVDGYADSNQLYDEYLAGTWAEVAIFSDPVSARDAARSYLGAGV